MKTGILTFYTANNYGAALQAFALQKKLSQAGVSCECIDYRCEAIERVHQLRRFNIRLGLKRNIKNALSNMLIKPRLKAFAPFRESIPHSRVYTKDDIKTANESYGAFITGSDQVFSLDLTGGDSTYFLDFADKGKLKISYAASMGKYLEEYAGVYKDNLSGFDLLSFRERTVAEKMKSEFGIDGVTVPDPVFLYSGEEWKKLLSIKDSRGEKYIVVYALFGAKTLFRAAEKLAADKGCRLYVITKIGRPVVKADKIIRGAGPKEFVELLANAEYVLSDSFHGTSFSMILEKQFYTVLPPNAQDRILDLMKNDVLKKRIITDGSDFAEEPLDISAVREVTDGLRSEGSEYIGKIGRLIEAGRK